MRMKHPQSPCVLCVRACVLCWEDFFRGQEVNEVALAGLDHCVVCTAAQDQVHVRHYHIGFQRSGSKVRASRKVVMSGEIDLRGFISDKHL